MGMTTGSTPVSGDFHAICNRSPRLQFHKIPIIMSENIQTALCSTKGTYRTAGTESGYILFHPLSVRKRQLIQLAKNRK